MTLFKEPNLNRGRGTDSLAELTADRRVTMQLPEASDQRLRPAGNGGFGPHSLRLAGRLPTAASIIGESPAGRGRRRRARPA